MNQYHKIQSIFKRDMETKGEPKPLIEGKYSLPEFEYLKDNIWRWDEKIDGCLSYYSKIITDNGLISIGTIVNQKLPVKVLSYNEKNNTIEFKEIKHYHKEKRLRPFLTIFIRSKNKGSKPKHIVCTDNHKFYSNGKWIQAKDLKKGQIVSHITEGLPYELKQIILGGLLGDSSIYRPSKETRGFGFIHSIKQSDYFEYKKLLFGHLFKECKGSIGGYKNSLPNRRGNSIVNRTISNLILNYCEKDGKKYITKKWVNELHPLAIAIWYMDDGSANFNLSQRPRARFFTNGFSLEEVQKLQQMFKNKYNIDSKIFNYKGWVLCLSVDGTEKLFSLIFPYICKSMKYKLPKKYKNIPCVLKKSFNTKPTIINTEVIKVSKKMPKSYMCKGRYQPIYQYDISIKDNSNYFTNSILVHNTNIRIQWITDPLISEVIIKGRTDRAEIPKILLAKLQEMFPKKKLLEVFGEGEDKPDICLYGEGISHKVNNGGKYFKEGKGNDFVLFDIKIGNWWLKREDIENLANQLGIDIVPIVGYGTLSEAVELVKSGQLYSKLGKKDFLAEGLVLRPEIELKARNGKRIITKIKHRDFQK